MFFASPKNKLFLECVLFATAFVCYLYMYSKKINHTYDYVNVVYGYKPENSKRRYEYLNQDPTYHT